MAHRGPPFSLAQLALSSSAFAHSSLRRGLSLSLPLASRPSVPSLPRKRADCGRREPPHQVGHLCSISKKRFIISFAPYTLYYAALKQLGSLAPGPSKATRAYLHKEADVVAASSDPGRGSQSGGGGPAAALPLGATDGGAPA